MIKRSLFCKFHLKHYVNKKNQDGFTLVEVLIAGLILVSVMAAMGQISVSSLAGSSKLSERRRIEGSIESHIQLIQQADSLLTYEKIPESHKSGENDISRACRNPATYLRTAFEQQGMLSTDDWEVEPANNLDALQMFPGFQPPGTQTTPINVSMDPDEDRGILKITYSFDAPESNIGVEKRIVELSPNFQSYCTPYEAL